MTESKDQTTDVQSLAASHYEIYKVEGFSPRLQALITADTIQLSPEDDTAYAHAVTKIFQPDLDIVTDGAELAKKHHAEGHGVVATGDIKKITEYMLQTQIEISNLTARERAAYAVQGEVEVHDCEHGDGADNDDVAVGTKLAESHLEIVKKDGLMALLNGPYFGEYEALPPAGKVAYDIRQDTITAEELKPNDS